MDLSVTLSIAGRGQHVRGLLEQLEKLAEDPPYSKCSPGAYCEALKSCLNHTGFGRGLMSLDLMSIPKGIRHFGVCYKTSAKDGGLLLNVCPFCGGNISSAFEA